MKLLIITNVPHKKDIDDIYSYGPYVREMNLWTKKCKKIKVISHLSNDKLNPIDIKYDSNKVELISVPAFNLNNKKEKLKTFFKIPYIIFILFKEMYWAEHIHLRCPSNMGLLGSLVQIFFPSRIKTAKYASNWDENNQLHFSWYLQRKILVNNFLTRNIQVLSYGDWKDNNKNVLPFFTATYSQDERVEFKKKDFNSQIKIVFVGILNKNKRSDLSLKVVKILKEKGFNVHLDVFGEGELKEELSVYIKNNKLENFVILHGNKDKEVIKKYFEASHFLFFFSQSEGWPKVVAEAMFLGSFPVTTNISCLPYMLDYGKRGYLLDLKQNELEISGIVEYYINNPNKYNEMREKALLWSQKYTVERFEKEINQLLMKE